MDEKMMVSGGDQSTAVKDAIAVGGFFDFDFAIAIQAIGKGPGEEFRHVLDDGDSGTVQRHRLEEFTDGFGAAGGCPDGDDFWPSCGLTTWQWAQRQNYIGGIARRWWEKQRPCPNLPGGASEQHQ